MSDRPVKGSCWVDTCGPCVKTGFHTSQYWVCKKCKEEVSQTLATAINEHKAKKDKPKRKVEYTRAELEFLYSLGVYPDYDGDSIGTPFEAWYHGKLLPYRYTAPAPEPQQLDLFPADL